MTDPLTDPPRPWPAIPDEAFTPDQPPGCPETEPGYTPSPTPPTTRLRANGGRTAADSPLPARIPSVIKGTNGHLIATIAPLYLPADEVTLDLTYEAGGWWTEYRPNTLVTNDWDPAADTTVHEDFRRTTFPDEAFTRIVFDPPYVSVGSRTKSTLAAKGSDQVARYAMDETERTPRLQHIKVIGPGIREAARILSPGGFLLVKAMSYVTGGHVQHADRWIESTAEDCGLTFWDHVIHHTGLGPQPTRNIDGSPRVQQHVHSAHSLLLVFRKPEERKPRTRKPAATAASAAPLFA